MDDTTIQPVMQLPFSFAKRHGVVITGAGDGYVTVTYRPGVARQTITELRRVLSVPLELVPVAADRFVAVLTDVYESRANETMEMAQGLGNDLDLSEVAQQLAEPGDLLESDDDAPIIRLINALLTEAIKENASDIHIEPYETRLVVRFRVDGVLREVLQPKQALAPLITSRVKVMAKLDIAEKRLPQDGRISLRVAGRPVDVRVSTIPSGHGERVVLRLLNKQEGRLDLEQLGMDSSTLAMMDRLIQYYLDGIGQTQVNPKVDMSFARGLRAILRQDPDVVMVGEIRDLETTQIAVQASLTGHLVLSTLHTNTAVGAVTRLRDMGVEPFLLSSSLIGVLAQRLVRKLCDDCRRPYQASPAECEVLGLPEEDAPMLYAPVGCENCRSLGYCGRTGIFELIPINDALREMIHERAGEHELEAEARRLSPSIHQDGRRRVLNGDTSLEELLRVTQEATH
jgi:general secretion pathway protein E